FLTGDRVGRSGAVPQAAFLGAAAVIAGLVVGGAPGVSKDAFLGWQRWNPLAKADPRVNGQYVWDQTDKPLHGPKKRTVVLEGTAGITVDGALIPPFGSNGPVRGAPVPQSYVQASDAVWKASGAANAKTPFGAAFLVEHYLRSSPFTYDLTPHQKKGVPPLVDF